VAIRINDLARELGVKSRLILNALPDLGVDTKKNHSSSLDASEAEKVRDRFRAEPNYRTTCVAQDTRESLIAKGIIKPAQALAVKKGESVPCRSALSLNKEKALSEGHIKHKKSFCTVCRREISANELLHHVMQKHDGRTRCVICGRQVQLRYLAGHTKYHKRKRSPNFTVPGRTIIFTGTPEPIEKRDTRIPCQQCGAKVFPHAMELHITNNHSKEKGIIPLTPLEERNESFISHSAVGVTCCLPCKADRNKIMGKPLYGAASDSRFQGIPAVGEGIQQRTPCRSSSRARLRVSARQSAVHRETYGLPSHSGRKGTVNGSRTFVWRLFGWSLRVVSGVRRISRRAAGSNGSSGAVELVKGVKGIIPKEKAEHLPDMPSTQFPFVVLPAGHWNFREVFDYYRRNSVSHPRRFFEQVFDWNRIEQLAKLEPNLRHFGVKAWFGYAVYEFSYSHRVVLECPIEGNATYIISGEWKEMIHKTKAELRSKYANQCTRVVHVGDWLDRVSEALRASGVGPQSVAVFE